MRNAAPEKNGIAKASAKGLFDRLFEEQKATNLRVDKMIEKLGMFLNHTGDLMTDMYVYLNERQDVGPGRELTLGRG